MNIGTISLVLIAVLIVALFFYLYYQFLKSSIKSQIEERVDKNAPPEVQDKQREEAELEIVKVINKFNQLTYNNGFM